MMVIERTSRRDSASSTPMTSAERARVVMRFMAIESAGVVALGMFLIGFFVLEWFPGQPLPILVGALFVFSFYVLFAMWASGLLAMITTGRSNAGR